MAQWRSDVDTGPRWQTDIVPGSSDEEEHEALSAQNLKESDENRDDLILESSHLVRSVTSLDAKLAKDAEKQISINVDIKKTFQIKQAPEGFFHLVEIDRKQIRRTFRQFVLLLCAICLGTGD